MSYFSVNESKIGIEFPLYLKIREDIPLSKRYYVEFVDFYNDKNIL